MGVTSEISEAIKVAPPVAVTGFSFIGVPFQQWVYVVTIIYTVFQIIRLLPKMYGCLRCFSRTMECNRSCKGD